MSLKSRLKKLEQKSGRSSDWPTLVITIGAGNGSPYSVTCLETQQNWRRDKNEPVEDFWARVEADAPGLSERRKEPVKA